MMNCEDFERAWEALDDPSLLSSRMEEHRRACPACAAWVEDLHHIRRQARQLLLSEPPSDAVWIKIRDQLEQSGLIREPAAEPRGVARSSWFGWLPPLPMGLAYATVFLLAFGVVYLRGILTHVPAPSPVSSSPPAEAVAVSPEPQPLPREEAVRQLLEKFPPERRSVYFTNWQRVNSSIEQLQDFARTNPDDPLTQRQLFTAYEHKQRLWETMVRWEEF